jgi:hypothetical protein
MTARISPRSERASVAFANFRTKRIEGGTKASKTIKSKKRSKRTEKKLAERGRIWVRFKYNVLTPARLISLGIKVPRA